MPSITGGSERRPSGWGRRVDYSDVAPTTECYGGPEAAMISFALDRVRAQFAWKTGGLSAAQMNRPS
jgi:hypothetical protein